MRPMRMPTVMGGSHNFAQVPSVAIQRSVLDRSHGFKTTFDAGFLIPVLCDEILPGDTIHCEMTAFCRLLTLKVPLMDNLYLESFFFFVPNRLVWTNWPKFMGEQTNPGDSISFVIPSLGVPFTPVIGDIFDQFGTFPRDDATQIQTPNALNALPYRGYNLIYNQWFRDENLINSLTVTLTDGPDPSTNYALRKRGKRHDYFTSCLPFLQKGTAVSLPLTGNAPVKGIALDLTVNPIDGNPPGSLETGGSGPSGWAGYQPFSSPTSWYGRANQAGAAGAPKIEADLSAVSAATINDLRLAWQIQKLLERDARGGTRYTEIVRAHFGVVSPDARLQRAEYLGGGSSQIHIGAVQQTSASAITGSTTPGGELFGTGTAFATGHGFSKSFTEHGYLIGLINVRADLTYQQGVERMWWKSTRYDFYWPEFSHIGEQAVLNREIFWEATTALNAQDVAVFGYQERHAEYRYKPSRIAGLFRSTATAPLDQWHLAQRFTALPTLSQTFIEDDTESILDRVVSVPSEPDFKGDFYFKYRCARPMPVFGVPGLVDHF